MFKYKDEGSLKLRWRCLLPALLAGALAGCASAGVSPLPAGSAAYRVVPEATAVDLSADALKPGDRLSIRVFGEPELTGDNFIVDAAGYIQVPLVGEMIVLQQSPRAVAAEIERRLGARFVRNASVTVSVVDRPLATFAVEGDVSQPGVYPAVPNTSLLSALAQARSPSKTAELNDVIVLRRINGERAGARFNLAEIRLGRAPDPQILAGDTVVVGRSPAKAAWADFLQAAPLFNFFYLVK